MIALEDVEEKIGKRKKKLKVVKKDQIKTGDRAKFELKIGCRRDGERDKQNETR